MTTKRKAKPRPPWPTTFDEFRTTLAEAYTAAVGRPAREHADRMAMLAGHDYEGPELQDVWHYWQQWEYELADRRDDPDDLAEAWEEYGRPTLVRDCLIEYFGLPAGLVDASQQNRPRRGEARRGRKT